MNIPDTEKLLKEYPDWNRASYRNFDYEASIWFRDGFFYALVTRGNEAFTERNVSLKRLIQVIDCKCNPLRRKP